MGRELWRRSTRNVLGPALLSAMAAVGVYLAVRTQWAWTRGMLVAFALILLYGALDAARAEVVVGTEGILSRRTYSRTRIGWSEVADFSALPRGRRAQIAAVLTSGQTRPLIDWALDLDRATALISDLKGELARHRP